MSEPTTLKALVSFITKKRGKDGIVLKPKDQIAFIASLVAQATIVACLPEKKLQKPMHGTCCTCQVCGYPNDDYECECERNGWIADMQQRAKDWLSKGNVAELGVGDKANHTQENPEADQADNQ